MSLDAKIAKLSGRVADRTAQTRAALKAIGALDLAEAAKGRFGARLAYLKTPDIELGDATLMRPGCVWTAYTKPKKRRGEE